MTARSLRFVSSVRMTHPREDHRYPKDVRHANGGLAACALPIYGSVRGPDARPARGHLKDRLTAIALAISDIREPIGPPLQRIRLRAPSPSGAEVGASRSRIGLRESACSIATAVAIGLTALSLVLAASASATVPVTGMVQVITRPLRLAKAGLMAPTARPDRRHLTDQTVSKTRRPIRTCLPTRKRRTPWRPDTTSARDPKETDHCCPGAPTLLAVGWEVLPNG